VFLHFVSFVSVTDNVTVVETPSNFNVSKISKRLQILEFLFKTLSNFGVSVSKRRQIQSFKSISKATQLHFSSMMMGSQFQKHGGRQGPVPIKLVTPLRLSSRPCSLQHQ